MRFVLGIDMTTSGFFDKNSGSELALILHRLAAKLDGERMVLRKGNAILDSSDNVVGYWEVLREWLEVNHESK